MFEIRLEAKREAPDVAIEGLEISGGKLTDSEGGDIDNVGGKLALVEDWITAGTAISGGGIFNEPSTPKESGTLVLVRSLVSGNSIEGGGGGGGIESESFGEEKAVLAVQDSTIADNTAGTGAGILGSGETGKEADNEIVIIGSTIAQNKATSETGAAAGAGLLSRASHVDVAGSIVAENAGLEHTANTESNCAAVEGGTIVSLGYNLENGSECGFTSTGDLQGVNPGFSPNELSNNGGNTETLAPALTSRAVNAIPTSFAFCNGVDQRGVARPQGSGCDMGAVEYERALSKGPTPGPPTVTNVHIVSVTTTTATLGFTINPNGAATYVVDYGPTTGYGQATEPVNIGATAGEQSLTRTITGLQSNHTYHFDVVATNALAAAGARSADQPFTTPAATFASLPEPALGKTANVEPVSGTVLIAVPGAQAASAASLLERGLSSPAAAFESLSKGLHFVPLTEARQIPVGSVLETTHGVVAIGHRDGEQQQTAVRQLRRGDLQVVAGAQAEGPRGTGHHGRAQRASGLCDARQARCGGGEVEQQGARPAERERAREIHDEGAVQRGDRARHGVERDQSVRRDADESPARCRLRSRLPPAQDDHAVHRAALPSPRALTLRASFAGGSILRHRERHVMRLARRVRVRSARAVAMLLLALAVGAWLAASAQAATYTVGTTKDVTGICASPPPAPARCGN